MTVTVVVLCQNEYKDVQTLRNELEKAGATHVRFFANGAEQDSTIRTAAENLEIQEFEWAPQEHRIPQAQAILEGVDKVIKIRGHGTPRQAVLVQAKKAGIEIIMV